MKRKIFTLYVFIILTVPAVFGSESRSRNDTVIRVCSKNYCLKVNPGQNSFSILRGERTVLESRLRETSGIKVFIGDQLHTLSAMTATEVKDDRIICHSPVDETNYEAVLTFRLLPGNVRISLNIPGITAAVPVRVYFPLASGGHWYGGNVVTSHHWPMETGSFTVDPFSTNRNQTVPFWLNSNGTGIFANTHQEMAFGVNEPEKGYFFFEIRNQATFSFDILVGEDISDVYDLFMSRVGLPQHLPPVEYFSDPIFNTWVEYFSKVTQEDVLNYATRIREENFPGTVLIIDDGWQSAYGDHTFDPVKFPDPKRMTDSIHALGFRLFLWDVPMIDPDAANYKLARKNHYLFSLPSGKPGLVNWWHDPVSPLDLSNQAARDWYRGELETMQERYGIDGFKLDAGDGRYFKPEFKAFSSLTPTNYTDLFLELGSHFTWNEFKVGWLSQQLGIVQRLRDKEPRWTGDGAFEVLPVHGMTLSMLGYPYWSPDMIGGGLDVAFLDKNFGGMDGELFVRWTQASAFMPMMQFSYGPWRLEQPFRDICLKYARLHQEMGDYIYSLAQKASHTGEPILKPLFFDFPRDERCYLLKDEYLLGSSLLVAPVMQKDARNRNIYLPTGIWKDFWSERIYHGGQTLKDFPAPLDKIPVFIKL